jgi:methionyl-tRNA formyltransferase
MFSKVFQKDLVFSLCGDEMLRIIVVGQGPFGKKVLEALLKKGEGVVGSFSPPDKRGEEIKILAEKSDIPFFGPNSMKDPQVYDAYVKLKPDLVMLAFVTDIIPE